MILTYKYRLKDRSAKKRLRAHAWAVNQTWNYCVAFERDRQSRYKAGAAPRKRPSAYDLDRLTSGTSKELGTLSSTINQVCHQFAKSRDQNKRCPRFRASGGPKRALGWVPFKDGYARRIEGNSIIYCGRRYRWFGNKRRPLPEIVKNGSFVEDALGRWWVCFHVEVANLPTGNGEIGVDLGLKTIAACSDGAKVENLRHTATWAQRLAKAQRSRNKRRVKAIHARIANARKDHIHKVTSELAARCTFIAVGNVSSSKLAKTRTGKSVLDAGWGMFRSQLRYKASRHGAVYLGVDERFTTQTCCECGSIAGPKGYAGLNERRWVCDGCGASHDRDVNSAVNILRLGLSAQAHADESRCQPDKHDLFTTDK